MKLTQVADTMSGKIAKWLKNYGQRPGVLSIEQAQREWEIAIDAVQDLIFIHDADMRIVRANHAYAVRAGKDIRDIIGKPYWTLFPKLDGPLPGCRRSLEERQGGEEQLRLESGEEYVSRSYPICDVKGKYLYSLHVMQDVTEKRKAEAEQRTLSEALRQAAEGVLVLNADTRITYLNPAFYRLFGYAPDDIIGQPIAALSVPEQEDNLQPSEVIRQLNENGICRDEVWRRAKDGTAIPVRLSTAAIRDAKGNISGYIGTYLDLREAKQAEQALRESENRLRVIMESVQTGIVIIDPDVHKIVDVNAAAVSMIGAPKEEIVGSACHRFICPAEVGKCPITDLHQTVDHSERVLLTATGARRPVIKSVTTVLLGGKVHLLESFIDITERKQMEERLNASLAEKEELVQSLNELATHDGLTGLYNHREFYKLLENEIVRGQRFNRPVSLLLLDIDHFKRVNDVHGHLAGDAVLKGLSELLGRQARAIDRVCRYGGEEITVILPETDLDAAADVAERLRAAVEAQPFGINAVAPMRITVSIGVAAFPAHADNAHALVAAADVSMYAAKQGGRNRIRRYEPALGQVAAQR
ncbi:response regulator PleD [mine drainage metagenome]|uniref:Response regulator PleD n=1 Tax=mine drainage metagenome TaxID=410659 RepID=A0A1J5RJG2_9ZZZZ